MQFSFLAFFPVTPMVTPWTHNQRRKLGPCQSERFGFYDFWVPPLIFI